MWKQDTISYLRQKTKGFIVNPDIKIIDIIKVYKDIRYNKYNLEAEIEMQTWNESKVKRRICKHALNIHIFRAESSNIRTWRAKQLRRAHSWIRTQTLALLPQSLLDAVSHGCAIRTTVHVCSRTPARTRSTSPYCNVHEGASVTRLPSRYLRTSLFHSYATRGGACI